MTRTIALIVALFGFTTPALADVIPLDGQYGNRDGCHYYLTGEVRGPLMLLTSDTLTSPEAQCDFDTLTATGEGTFTIAAVCSGTGDFAGNPDMVTVAEGGAAGYFVTLKGLHELGPFIPCINFADEKQA